MELNEALYTTRAMRRVKPDPIPDDVIAAVMDAAIRAPSPGNTQQWRFVAVTDREVMAQLGQLYSRSWNQLTETAYAGREEAAREQGDDQTLRVMSSAGWLAANFADVPLAILAFTRNDVDGSGIYPAVWNLMLAARGYGIGATLTTVLHHFAAEGVAQLLDVPTAKGWRNAACVTLGYPLGKWGVANRPPVHEVVYADRWGSPPGWQASDPKWSY